VIRATQLTKRFASLLALDGVGFEARPGEVLGFLGPNGAGKTTTMRILTGFLPASSGTVEICGLRIDEKSREARAKIGYLPESVPLYAEMRIYEYLHHRAALKEVPRRERKARCEEAMRAAGIVEEARRPIGQLSKGYRQRVGLADALLHRPPVLILDEPTDGLDPNQRRDVLELVRKLGEERTVVLSTHILPEVENVCGRVVILDRGRVIADARPSELLRSNESVRVVARGDRAELEASLRAVEHVTSVAVERVMAEDVLVFRVESSADVREAIAQAVQRIGHLRELAPARAGLDEVFARLTGRGAT
jgi:ABC-2 type transport system ATP-binding protein